MYAIVYTLQIAIFEQASLVDMVFYGIQEIFQRETKNK